MILDKIAENVKLNDNDKMLLQYIKEHLEEVPHLSSRELARRNYMSSTGVLRCIKKLGFNTYNDFKLSINSYLKNYAIDEVHVSENDDLLDLINKTAMLNEKIIDKTKELLSLSTLNKVIAKFNKCTFVDIIANDENVELAEYASYNFCKAGKMVTVYKTAGKQMFFGLNVPPDHLVIVISKYGENANILKTMKILKKRHIPTISIISEQNEEMEALSNDTIFCAYDNTVSSYRELVFSISVKYVLDLLYAAIFTKNYEKTMKNEEIFTKLFLR